MEKELIMKGHFGKALVRRRLARATPDVREESAQIKHERGNDACVRGLRNPKAWQLHETFLCDSWEHVSGRSLVALSPKTQRFESGRQQHRHRKCGRLGTLAYDPDVEVPKWSRHGWPLGIVHSFHPSGVVPAVDKASAAVEEWQSFDPTSCPVGSALKLSKFPQGTAGGRR